MKAGQLTEGLSVTALHGPAPRCSVELSSYYLLPFSLESRRQTLLTPRVFLPRGISASVLWPETYQHQVFVL